MITVYDIQLLITFIYSITIRTYTGVAKYT